MDALDALANLDALVDTTQDLLIQCVARFDEEKYSRAIAKLKFLATKLPTVSATAGETREGQRRVALLDPKVKECSRLVRLVRDKRGGGGTSARAPPPQSHFDEVASREKEGLDQQQEGDVTVTQSQQDETEELKTGEEEKEKEKESAWKDVSLLAVARFDFSGDAERNLLSIKRGDGLVLLQEAKGFYFGRLAGATDEEAGLVAASYVEVFTQETLLQRYSQQTEKLAALRSERDQAVQATTFARDKAAAIIGAVNELKNEMTREEQKLRSERDALSHKLEEAEERIEQLEVQVAIVEGGLEAASEPPPPPVRVVTPVAQAAPTSVVSPAPLLGRSQSPEIETSSFSKLLSALDEHLTDPRQRKPEKMFGAGLSLAVICEGDNAAVPALLERLCEHLLANGAAGVRTPGIFRVSAAKADVDAAKLQVEQEGVWSFKPELHSPIVIADLLKAFLRNLNEPLLTHELLPRWVLATKIKSSAVQVPYVRALLASLPPENIGTIEYLLNFLTIAIGYEESLLTLSNAALLFAPMFLSHDVSSDRKRADLLAGSAVKKTGFTPLFSRRRQSQTPSFALEVEAVDLKELMSAGVNVVSMLLVNFREIWLRFNNARPFALVRAVKESGPARATDEIEYKKGATIGMFLKLPDGSSALGECNGRVGRFALANTKTVEIE